MAVIPSVSQQDFNRSYAAGAQTIIQRFSDLLFVIAESIYGCVKLGEIYIFWSLCEKWEHIAAPCKCFIIGILSDIVMVPRNEHHFCVGQPGKQIVCFL